MSAATPARLTYFTLNARAHVARIALRAAGVPFEDRELASLPELPLN